MTTSNAKYPKIGQKSIKSSKWYGAFWKNVRYYANFLENQYEFWWETGRFVIEYLFWLFNVQSKFHTNVNMAHTKSKRTEPTPIVVWKNWNILRKSVLIFWLVFVKRSYNDVKLICRIGKMTYQKKYTVKFHKEKPIKLLDYNRKR